MGNISKNFSWQEFFTAQDIQEAQSRGIDLVVLLDMRMVNKLQMIRNHFGNPVTITSGFRSFEHNQKIGGAKYSQHQYGRAVDFVVKDIEPHDVQTWIQEQGWTGGLGLGKNFTHYDIAERGKNLVVFNYS